MFPASLSFSVRQGVLLLALGASMAVWGGQELPASVEAALQRAQVPREALSVVVLSTQAGQGARPVGMQTAARRTAKTPRQSTATPSVDEVQPWLAHRATALVNPASLMKLVTTTVALEQLGPAFTWSTPVYVDGVVRDGVLQGNLYLRGQGDPRLGVERLWLLLRRIQGLGIQRIDGDIVLDRSAFDVSARDPGGFDGEPLRPYNVSPDALLVNFKSVLIHFVPDRNAQVARVHVEPPLAGVQFPLTLPLNAGECLDYRSSVRLDLQDPLKPRFAGSYPASCGERVWPLAHPDPTRFTARVIQGLWQQLGGQLGGSVREGPVPPGLRAVFSFDSAPLAEVVRDINKFSNNVMAQQLFLTLSWQAQGVGRFEASREWVGRWWREQIGADELVLDNGSGLSRHERITALGLARLLRRAWASPYASELMSSLPLAGQDGTLKRSQTQAVAHLKTGSLRDVVGVAGYVDGPHGERWVLVAIVNHSQAQAARPALEALVEWVAKQPGA
jgi:D-alanyl-D-alanine carboxypeptidase/D-alanyl-D-alanine-endopeptidase (penicillin-binding protein 4)